MSSRIAYLINQYPKVSHTFIRREILELEKQGVEVFRIAVRGWNGDAVDEEDLAERAKTHYLLQGGFLPVFAAMLTVLLSTPSKLLHAAVLTSRRGRRSDKRFIYHLVYLAEACLLVRWLKQENCTHVHAHFGTNPAELAILARALGGPPYSFTAHGPEEFDRREALGIDEKVQHSAFVVAVSSFGRSQLYRGLKHEYWPKVQVVHCGLERRFYEGPRRAAQETSRLVCVGRLCEQKGQLLLVEACRLLAQRDIDFELVLAGDGEMRGDIEALIARYGLDGKIRITGWINADQVKHEILESRALVLPSFAEGLPVVIMEAMALRRPVLTTSIAGIPELVRHGEDGFLFAAGSVEELARAMEHCLGLPTAVLEKMGDSAHARVIERHSIETEVSKLAKLFRGSTHAARIGDSLPSAQGGSTTNETSGEYLAP